MPRDPEFHPVCLSLPPLPADEFNRLVEDIHRYGLRDPIVLYEGQILDGRNRYYAAKQAGVDPVYVHWQPKRGETAADYVVSSNLVRRHLSASQRAAVAVELEPQFVDEDGRSIETAAGVVGVSAKYAYGAKRVKQDDPEAFEELKAGDITLQEAKRGKRAESVKKGKAPVVRHDDTNEEVRDDRGQPLPTEVAQRVFTHKGELVELASIIQDAIRRAEAVDGELGRELRASVKTDLRNAKRAVRSAIPYAKCPFWPQCQHGCRACKGTGWVTKAQWELVPVAIRGGGGPPPRPDYTRKRQG